VCFGVRSAQERQFWDNGGSAGDWPSLDQQQDIRVNLASQTRLLLASLPKIRDILPSVWSYTTHRAIIA